MKIECACPDCSVSPFNAALDGLVVDSALVVAGVAQPTPATLASLPLAREWIAGPVIDGTDSSTPIKGDSTGSFEFQIDPKAIHYVTQACGSLAAATRIRSKTAGVAAELILFDRIRTMLNLLLVKS